MARSHRDRRRGWQLGVWLLLLSSCAPAKPPVLVDLTYPFDNETIYWPTNKSFQWEKTDWGPTPGGYWYASAMFAASEHGGTHLDAPVHFAATGSTLDQIPLDRLIGPAIVLDVREQCDTNPDYEVSIHDVEKWEQRHGRIAPGELVLIRTGWGQYWPDPGRYLGSQTPRDPRSLHFPGLSAAAANLLAMERRVRGVGIDTASIDPGRSPDFPVHRVLSRADLYALENLALLERLPARGTAIFALPMKIRGGTGGPARVIALLPAR